jgi:hypothetical protein
MAKKPAPTDPPDDDDDDEPFTPKQLAAMNNTITAAVTSHVKRQLKPVQDQLGVLPTIQETLEKLAAGGGVANQPNAGAAGAAGAGAGGAANPPAPKGEDPEIVAMRKRVNAIEEERKAEVARARNERRDASLTTIVTTSGVDKNRVRGVVALLREQTMFDKDGNPIMRVNRNGLDEEVPLDEGARDFFNTDEGKSYLAPQNPAPRGGSGARTTNAASVVRGTGGANSGNNAPQRGAKGDKAAAKADATQALAEAVGELMGGGNITLG